MTTVGETLGGIPVDAIGGSSTITYGTDVLDGISEIGIDSFNVAVDMTSYIASQ